MVRSIQHVEVYSETNCQCSGPWTRGFSKSSTGRTSRTVWQAWSSNPCVGKSGSDRWWGCCRQLRPFNRSTRKLLKPKSTKYILHIHNSVPVLVSRFYRKLSNLKTVVRVCLYYERLHQFDSSTQTAGGTWDASSDEPRRLTNSPRWVDLNWWVEDCTSESEIVPGDFRRKRD